METRRIDKLGLSVSHLGMGCMRLPTAGDKIDYPAAEKLIDMLMEGGVNFYDTAYMYHGGESQAFLKKALVDRYPRDRYVVATKLPLWQRESREECEKIFEEQRQALGLSCIDLYHLHGIGEGSWNKAKELGAHDMQKRLKAEGKIKYIGFSFHDKAEALPRILDEGEWDFVQIQLNYNDWYRQDARKLYEEIAKRGIAMIAMEPVRGGGLAAPHPDVADVFKKADPSRSVASWALRWCQSLPDLTIVLSGMSNAEQVSENLALFSVPQPLNDAEQQVVTEACKALETLPIIPCTDCKYCDGCPQEIPIPRLFGGYNQHLRFGRDWFFPGGYKNLPPEKQASACIACGACEAKCPQKIEIIKNLKMAHDKAMSL